MAVLTGIKVLDFTSVMAGPTCTLQLGDFGADVVKVESPAGDASRRWGNHRFGKDGQFSGLFVALNRNKKSIALDLKTDTGQDLVRGLMAEADVLVENFTPGVADRLGIGYEAAAELNPRVIYCSISGFGQYGPLRDRPGLDMLMQAYAGHMSVTGEEGRPSIRTGPSPIDFLTGTNAALGIVLALYARDRTGRGQYLETSLYDTAIELMTHYIADCSGSGVRPRKWGPFFAFSSPYGVFAGSDREFYLGVSSNRSYERLCTLIDRPDLLDDPRFASNALRIDHRAELHAELWPIFRKRQASEWVADLVAAGIPSSLINDLDEVLRQEQAIVREMLIDADVDGITTAGIPIKMRETPGAMRTRAPDLGSSNACLPQIFG